MMLNVRISLANQIVPSLVRMGVNCWRCFYNDSNMRAGQENSGQLQAVLDMVLSHHAVTRKSLFVKEILMALVLPSPQDYRPLLRRLTNLTSEPTRELSSEARQLLEQSLLADLRAVVARALSGNLY